MFQAPVFHDLPHTVNIGEGETHRRLIYTLSVTDADSTFTCTQNGGAPSAQFEVNTVSNGMQNVARRLFVTQYVLFE